jgi:hypothetical protein
VILLYTYKSFYNKNWPNKSRGVYIFKCSRPEYSWKIARWTLNTNQSINQSIMFSPWYSWKIAELALNKYHSLSYGPLIMSIMLIMSCYTGFFNVRRGWQSLNTGPRFYLRLIRRTGLFNTYLVIWKYNCEPLWFEPRSGQTKDYKIGICCFSAMHAALKRKNFKFQSFVSWKIIKQPHKKYEIY